MSLSAFNNKSTLNLVTIFMVVFTFFMVETAPLMIIQFMTITITYSFLSKKSHETKSNPNIKFVPAKTEEKATLELIIKGLIYITLASGMLYGFSYFLPMLAQDSGLDDFSKINFLEIILGVIWFIIASIIPFLILLYFLGKICEYFGEIKSRF